MFFFIAPDLEADDEDFRNDQLGRNGLIEFVRAFRSNSISFKDFYATIPDAKVNQIVSPSDSNSDIKIDGKPNVVIIVVESLGAKFIGPLGGSKNTTPFLNSLTAKSIFFEKLYSSGTRTVRGLEAINLSIPPTPGYAVVKRPNHSGLYSLGRTFENNGYENTFLYGGRGFFDNMNSFFSGNNFGIIDQTDFSEKEISFKNAWGVCDEDLFQKARSSINARKSEKPFMYFLLTTSNHRPFTYPSGRVDIESGISRAGAVKYSDYALQSFFREIKEDVWFKNTLFVIVADHSTEGRGQFNLEVADFHIPMWFYFPSKLKPQSISKVSSLIDVLPTLISILNLKDDSPFFGRNILSSSYAQRAFIGNYQFVGYLKDDRLITLGPNRSVETFKIDHKTSKQVRIENSSNSDEAIAYYQKASDLLDRNLYKPTNVK